MRFSFLLLIAVASYADHESIVRSIENPGSFCYYNALLKAFAASPAFCSSLKETEAQRAFLSVVKMMRTKGKPLSHRKKPLRALTGLLQKHFPPLASAHEPQDLHELALIFLEEMRSDTLFYLRTDVQRCEKEELNTLFIPTLDREIPCFSPENTSSIAHIHVPEGRFSLQDFFSGIFRREEVDVDAVLKHERNRPFRAFKIRRGNLSILVLEKIVLEGKIPSFFPIYLVRSSYSTHVDVPLFLTVGTDKGFKKRYCLRSCVVRRGRESSSGHYCTYIPQTPCRWILHNDREVRSKRWDQIADEVGRKSCFLVYDLVDR